MAPLENLGLSIKRLQHRSYCTLNARLAPLGISLVQWNALREIKRHPGPSIHRLAACTFTSDQASATLMARLRRQKLVQQRPGAGRTNLHGLTERGETLLTEGTRCLRRTLAKIFAPLSADEHGQLQTLLNKVLGDNPYLSPCPVAPLTEFAETLAGVAPASGRPMIRAGGPRPKPSSPRAKPARSAKAAPKPGGGRQTQR